mmetsp:Transcript_7878/g.12202  ORF Transcript_7878/g.12202 Transcript_7878/m.12202 type:complete len:99 (+) Transcript_7878:1402-1698(+)
MALVQIKIENRRDPEAALDTIDKHIINLKERVQCLQMYVPKLVKVKQHQEQKDALSFKKYQANRILEMVKDIARALVEHVKFKSFKSEPFLRFTLKSH